MKVVLQSMSLIFNDISIAKLYAHHNAFIAIS